jgi:hypothetical protein
LHHLAALAPTSRPPTGISLLDLLLVVGDPASSASGPIIGMPQPQSVQSWAAAEAPRCPWAGTTRVVKRDISVSFYGELNHCARRCRDGSIGVGSGAAKFPARPGSEKMLEAHPPASGRKAGSPCATR